MIVYPIDKYTCPWRTITHLLHKLDPAIFTVDYEDCVKEANDSVAFCKACTIYVLKGQYANNYLYRLSI